MNTRASKADRNVGDGVGAAPAAARAPLRHLGLLVCVLSGLAGALGPAWADTPPGPSDKQESFATPQAAVDALAKAWHDASKRELIELLGPQGRALVSSGDAVAEKNAWRRLAAAYDARHTLETPAADKAVLVLGTEAFPYPIPLVKQAESWRFDTAAGAQEIIDRRIGRNELNAIEVCRTFVQAQREYWSQSSPGSGAHEYAMKFLSTEGEHDGLYWPAPPGTPQSPMGPLVAAAAAEGYMAQHSDRMKPYHGYFYKILRAQGANAPGGAKTYVVDGHMTRGFALIAFPARYGNSGIMTFMVNQDGIVFQKNLGPDTARLARRIDAFDPDHSWSIPAD